MLPLLKICGVASPASAALIDGVADYVGTVVAPPGLTPRAATPGEARRVARALAESTHVTVAAGMGPWEGLEAALAAGSQVLQPHAPLTPSLLDRLLEEAERHGIRVAPVLQYSRGEWSPRPRSLLPVLRSHRGSVEYVLLDAAKGEPRRGPPGWGLRVPPGPLAYAAEALSGEARVAVAGGVSDATACTAARLGASVVDVSSWADRPGMPGVKDPGRVALLADALRGCTVGGGGVA